MVEPISELRRRVQEPVRKYNDIAGYLVGDRVSIHVTRAFIALGLSPTVATIAFLVCGLAGSVLATFGGWWAVAGFSFVFLYYIFDCVDGEVARYHSREKIVWGFHDFMFHLYVKTAFFICLGIYAARTTGRDWVFFFALSALIATLFVKFLYDVSLILISRQVLMRSAEERKRFVDQLTVHTSPEELAVEGDLPGEHRVFAFDGLLSFVRCGITNFDLAVIVFLVAAVLDMCLQPMALFHMPCDLKVLLLVFYGVVLPLDFLDHLQAYIRAEKFHHESRRLLRRAHHFRIRHDD